MIKCILFDNDGTLIDSEMLGQLVLHEKLQEYDVNIPPEDLQRRFSGWKLATAMEQLSMEHSVSFADTFFKNYRASLSQLFEEKLQAIPGVEYALANITQIKAVVSGGPRLKITQGLKVTGLAHHFEERIFSSYDYNSWKPEPDIYWHAIKVLGFEKDECIIVEDSKVGLEAGVRSGIKTLYYNPSCLKPENENVVSFSSMKELPNVIRKIVESRTSLL